MKTKNPVLDLRNTPRLGYDLSGVELTRNGKVYSLAIGLKEGDVSYAAADVAEHMKGILSSVNPALSCDAESLYADPSRGFSVTGNTSDECVLELKVKPNGSGLTVEPFIGNGLATQFLGLYKTVLGREVVQK